MKMSDYPMYVICPTCGHSITFGTPYTIRVKCPKCGTIVERSGEPYVPPPKFICPHCGEGFDSQTELNQHIKEYHPDEPLPKRCIIATVFLGEDHPFLPPMRNFRDKFIPKQLMEIYYSTSVFILREIGKL